MRFSRQDKIVELINTYEIETQDALAEKLSESGYKVTQATISRDIKDLQLIKILSSSGRYKYALPGPPGMVSAAERYEKIFKNTVSSISYAGNIIVLKTLSGCANAACEAFDSYGIESVVGSLAGDNTVFIVIDLPENVPPIVKRFNAILRETES
jgi:transcriptional regulator of arginine metabolism